MPSPPTRNLCFTLNNPTLPNDEFQRLLAEIPGLRYAVWQRETGANGTPHLQGYVEFTSAKRYSALVGTCLEGSHFEPRRGSRDQARDYCRKEDSRTEGPFEYGEWKSGGQGNRTDLSLCCDAIKRGASDAEIAEEFSTEYVKFHKGFTALRQARTAPRDPTITPEVWLFYGPSGYGKSSGAISMGGDSYFNKQSGSWWDGYDNESWVVLDDFSGASMAYGDWKRTVDRYPIRVPFKGGFYQLTSTRFIMTSTELPANWWNPDTTRVNLAEIARRINHLRVFTGLNSFTDYHSTEQATALDLYLYPQ